MTIAFMTHRGAVRKDNQDALCLANDVRVGDMESTETMETTSYPILLATVDGMGGYRGGALASRIVAEVLAEASRKVKPFGDTLDVEADERILHSLLKGAARRMKMEARRAPDLYEMGATLSGLLIRRDSALAFNCGDCRAYRFSGGALERLSREHSIVQALFEQGEISEDEMSTHPRKNIVTSAISPDLVEDFELHVVGVSRCAADSFFLCSDGVWEIFDSQGLTHWLSRPFPSAAQDMFDDLMAKHCGDNISFIWQMGS
ncbi:MAG: protein phosphatase 2C domain-containing protein [Synergistaceae bacterium]|jgi:protein phosphatase|nr:protein phosphatase 2C domain-containing protein [Synergistaceae bacterium]